MSTFDPKADDEDASKARVLQAAVLMELFRRANRRDAETASELRDWAAGHAPTEAVEPSTVLSPVEIIAALQDCRRRR